MVTHVAAAVLLGLTVVGTVFAATSSLPGRQEGAQSVLAAPREVSATPEAVSKPVVEFLWLADGGPNAVLTMPAGAAVDPHGNLWVTDGGKGRFVILSPDGDVLETWGTRGSGEGEFFDPVGLALDGRGHIYVVEHDGERVQKFRLLPPLAP